VRRNSGITSGTLCSTGLIAISGFRLSQPGVEKDLIGGRFRYQVLWAPKSTYSGRRGYHPETNCISVSKFTQDRGHPDEAFELAYSWLTDPMSQYLARTLAVPPPSRKWLRSEEIASSAPGMENFADIVDEVQKIGNDRPKWQGGSGSSPKGLEWFVAVTTRLTEALVKGTDARVALRQATEEGDRALS
jgi:hypothetical protein